MFLRVGLPDSSFLKSASLFSANSLQVMINAVYLRLPVGKKDTVTSRRPTVFYFQNKVQEFRTLRFRI